MGASTILPRPNRSKAALTLGMPSQGNRDPSPDGGHNLGSTEENLEYDWILTCVQEKA